MDLSITLLTPEDWEDRGAQAYLDGLSERDHHLPVNAPERKHWQYGWHQQRVRSEQADQLAEVSPP